MHMYVRVLSGYLYTCSFNQLNNDAGVNFSAKINHGYRNVGYERWMKALCPREPYLVKRQLPGQYFGHSQRCIWHILWVRYSLSEAIPWHWQLYWYTVRCLGCGRYCRKALAPPTVAHSTPVITQPWGGKTISSGSVLQQATLGPSLGVNIRTGKIQHFNLLF